MQQELVMFNSEDQAYLASMSSGMVNVQMPSNLSTKLEPREYAIWKLFFNRNTKILDIVFFQQLECFSSPFDTTKLNLDLNFLRLFQNNGAFQILILSKIVNLNPEQLKHNLLSVQPEIPGTKLEEIFNSGNIEFQLVSAVISKVGLQRLRLDLTLSRASFNFQFYIFLTPSSSVDLEVEEFVDTPLNIAAKKTLTLTYADIGQQSYIRGGMATAENKLKSFLSINLANDPFSYYTTQRGQTPTSIGIEEVLLELLELGKITNSSLLYCPKMVLYSRQTTSAWIELDQGLRRAIVNVEQPQVFASYHGQRNINSEWRKIQQSPSGQQTLLKLSQSERVKAEKNAWKLYIQPNSSGKIANELRCPVFELEDKSKEQYLTPIENVKFIQFLVAIPRASIKLWERWVCSLPDPFTKSIPDLFNPDVVLIWFNNHRFCYSRSTILSISENKTLLSAKFPLPHGDTYDMIFDSKLKENINNPNLLGFEMRYDSILKTKTVLIPVFSTWNNTIAPTLLKT
jgi:hypothetical protein